MTDKKAHVIVISNEKGGTGKSTISMHLAIKLLQEGFSVAAIDMDGRQGTFSHYIANRQHFCNKCEVDLPMPKLVRIAPVEDYNQITKHLEETDQQITGLLSSFDAIIIDTPGNKNYLFEKAHLYADTLITPISDSLIDLNVLSEIDGLKPESKQAGHYAQYIWEVKKQLAAKGKPMLNWIVVANKISSLNSRNKNQVFEHLQNLSKTYGFRVSPSIKDRVIYKELFLQGLTVLDMNHEALKCKLSISHIAAKREIRDLAEFICP